MGAQVNRCITRVIYVLGWHILQCVCFAILNVLKVSVCASYSVNATWSGFKPSRLFIASVACNVPIVSTTGERTPASMQLRLGSVNKRATHS